MIVLFGFDRIVSGYMEKLPQAQTMIGENPAFSPVRMYGSSYDGKQTEPEDQRSQLQFNQQTLRSLASGDNATWTQLVTVNQARLIRRGVSAGASREDAEEAVQDAFVNFLRHLGSVQPEEEGGNPLGYLERAADNESRTRIRREAARARYVAPGLDDLLTAYPSTACSVESQAVIKEQLKMGLAAVDKSQRLALTLYAQGYSYDEIAQILNVSPDNIGVRIFRGRVNARASQRPDD